MKTGIDAGISEQLVPLAGAFRQNASVLAVVLSGSIAGNLRDTYSDCDLYVYSRVPIDLAWRRRTAEELAVRHEVGQRFYEDTDDWAFANASGLVEIIYRSADWIEERVRSIWEEGQASVGYSTCLVHNVGNAAILFDPEGWYGRLQAAAGPPYPELLRKNIIEKNLPMLSGKLNCSFDEQISIAVKRNDIVSMNHRVAAFVASYFDILFAINRITHPGEKKLTLYASSNCAVLPESFPHGIENLCLCPGGEKPALATELARELASLYG